MEKFKSHLLTAMGVAVVMLSITLFTSRSVVSQTTTTTKTPYQISVPAFTRITLPASKYFVVETVASNIPATNSSPYGSDTVITVYNTTAGNPGTYYFKGTRSVEGASSLFLTTNPFSTRFYCDPASALYSSAPVTLSGYLTKAL